MKTITVDVNVSTVLGVSLDKPLSSKIQVEQYESAAEAKAANDWLNDEEVLAVINRNRIASAKTKETLRLSSEERERIESTPEYKLSSTIANIRKVNPSLSPAKAEAMAKAILAAEG